MDILNNRILPLINQSSLSESKLEREIGLAKSTIYGWKSGRNKSYKKYIDVLAKYFDVDVDYLLGNQDIKKQVHQRNGEPVNEYTEKLSAMLNQMSLEDLQKVLEYVEFLQKKNNNQ